MEKIKFDCSVCLRSFSTQFGLKRHIRSQHDGNGSIFSCTLCFKSFKYKYNFSRHLKLHSAIVFECKECSSLFPFKKSLRHHMKAIHMKTAQKKVEFYQCMECSRDFKRRDRLVAHLKIHSKPKFLKTCTICNFSDAKARLIEHFQSEHGINLTIKQYKFKNMTEFFTWKEKIENETPCSFVKKRSKYQRTDGSSRMVYTCHREGIFKTKSRGERCLKFFGSNKIGFCPAQLDVATFTNEILVDYIETHVGHSLELHQFKKRLTKKSQQSSLELPYENVLNRNLDQNTILVHLEREQAELFPTHEFLQHKEEVTNQLLLLLDKTETIEDLNIISENARAISTLINANKKKSVLLFSC